MYYCRKCTQRPFEEGAPPHGPTLVLDGRQPVCSVAAVAVAAAAAGTTAKDTVAAARLQ